jgi:hypothetical protein
VLPIFNRLEQLPGCDSVFAGCDHKLSNFLEKITVFL